MGTWQVKIPQSSLLLSRVSCFFLNKHSLGCCKPLINFQSYEKLLLIILASFSLLVWRREFSEVLTAPFSLTSLPPLMSTFLHSQSWCHGPDTSGCLHVLMSLLPFSPLSHFLLQDPCPDHTQLPSYSKPACK